MPTTPVAAPGPGGRPVRPQETIPPWPEQVTKITIFVARYLPEFVPAIEADRAALFGEHRPADTLIGVATLSRDRYLIEVDAFAVADA